MAVTERLHFEELRVCRLALSVPVSIRPGLQLHERSVVFLRFKDERGLDYWGECPALVGVHDESIEDAIHAVKIWQKEQGGVITLDWNQALSWQRPYFAMMSGPELPSLRYAFEQVLWQAIFHNCPNSPRYQSLPRYWRGELCGLLALSMSESELKRLQKQSYSIVKVKLGRQPFHQELSLLDQLLSQSALRLRLDANQSLSLAELDAINARPWHTRIEAIEEPFAENDPAWNSYQGACPLARDESLWSMSPSQVQAVNYSLKLVLKPARMGVSGCLAWANGLRFPQTDIILSSCYESGWSQAFHLQLAAFLRLESALGLGTYHYLAEDVLSERLPLDSAQLNVELTLPQFGAHL